MSHPIFASSSRKSTVLALLLATSLTGCGGGGGGTGAAPAGPSSPLELTPSTLSIDADSSQKLWPTGGTPPYTFTVSESGGTIDANGLYKTPSQPGTATIKVTDSAGASVTINVTINPALSLTPSSATLTASSGQTVRFSASGGGGAYEYSIVSGSGTIDSTGLYTAGNTAGPVVVHVTDAAKGNVSASVQLLRIRTNGTVNAMIVDASGTYVGGSFTAVNPYLTSRAAVLDPASGKPILSCDLGTGFNAPVRTSLVVGNSLYVGGEFTSFNGHPAHGLAKLDATTCALDTTFTGDTGIFANVPAQVPPLPAPAVYALASNGSALFVGGNFTQYRGVPAQRIMKVDLQTGALDLTFTQPIGLNSYVTSVAASGDSVFISGDFRVYRDASAFGRDGPVKLNAISGDLDTGFVPPAAWSWYIDNMLVVGNSLYVPADTGILKLDVATGAVDATFAQGAAAAPNPDGLLALSGSSIIVAGSCADINGTRVRGVAKIDATTGTPDSSFNQCVPYDQWISSVSVSGHSVYLVGGFGTYGGQSVPGLARLDASTGNLDPSFGLVPGFQFATPESVVATPTAVYVTGAMLTYGGTPAQNIAKFDTNGIGDATFLQAPSPDGSVSKLLLSGNTLYVGGQFSHYGSMAAGSLAKVDALTGAADPQFSTGAGFATDFQTSAGNPADVLALALKNSSLYVGGLFASYRGQPAAPLVKLDAASGALDTGFTQATDFTGGATAPFYFPREVTSLAFSADSLYVAGNFATYRGVARSGLAKLDPASGTIDPAFDLHGSVTLGDTEFNSTVINALLISGDQLYLAGSPFTLGGGLRTSGLAKVNLLTGAPDAAFTQAITLSTYSQLNIVVKDLAQVGSSLYAAGNFVHYLGGAPYPQNLAKYDLATGKLDAAFSQSSGPNGTVNSLTTSGSSIYLNGSFDAYRGTVNPYSIAVDPMTGANNDK